MSMADTLDDRMKVINDEFLQAVKMRDLQQVEDTIKKGADINAKDSRGRTCLHYAMLKMEERIKNFSIRNEETKREFIHFCGGISSLPSMIYAIEKFSIEDFEEIPDLNLNLVKLLIDAGASVNAVDEKGNSCSHYAVEYNDCVDLIQLLLDSGANIDCVNSYGEWSPLAMALSIDNLAAIKVLMDHGADVKMKTPSCFHLAKSDEALRLLLDVDGIADILNVPSGLARKNDVRSGSCIGKTPLQSALEYCRVDTLEKMIQYGADVNYTGGSLGSLMPCTPLRAAIFTRRKEIVEVLLKHGADPNYVDDKDDDSSYGICGSSDFEFAIFYLGQRDSYDTNTSQEASENIIKLLISHGADYASSSGFEEVLRCGTVGMIRLFLNFFQHKGLKNCPDTYNPPLHSALKNENPDVFPFVLELRIGDLEQTDEHQNTLLNLAVQNCLEDQIAMLLDLGANINHMVFDEDEDTTILSEAFEFECKSCLELLFCYGSLPDSLLKLNDLNRSYKREFENLITMHVSLIEKLGRSVDPDIFNRIKRYTREMKFYAKCRKELELMRAMKIQDSVTVYDVLSAENFDKNAENLSLIVELKGKDLSQKFPIYHRWIQRRVIQLESRHKLTSNAMNGLQRIVGLELDAFNHIYQKIFRQLTRLDWYVLGKV
ncbi:hypothetical protein QAD02_004951 [Eretmocerus hayati]|uniref:Uncharacterized protein n=1 Tax=Eretmocerus hayati TaxID=131215 RepID=A0ACC2NR11_9HYME|nr:hypothetical protein QAD02_004951 [Eretmocerus hayati]